jgi:hypothetical protein
MKDNNNNKTVVTNKGVGFTGMLTIAFIVLKLCKVINWSWVWVLSPLWISAALGVFFIIVVAIIYKFID